MTTRFVPGQSFIGLRARTVRADGLDVTLILALDTGATYSMLTRRAWELLGHSDAELGETVSVAAVGAVASGRWGELPRIAVLGRRAAPWQVAVMEMPRVAFHGLLGLDFLRNSRLTIDFRRGEIELES
ncbi:MAG: retroviral-like aspartic protease family protein [Tepidiformaceae bacterium]